VLHALPCCLVFSCKDNFSYRFLWDGVDEGEQPDLLSFYHKARNPPLFRCQELYKNNIFFIAKSVNMSFPTHMTLFNLFFLGESINRFFSWTPVQNGGLCFRSRDNLWQEVVTSSNEFVWKWISISLFVFYVHVSHSRQSKNTGLGKRKLINKYHYTGFTFG
jgi:hypothetical protein